MISLRSLLGAALVVALLAPTLLIAQDARTRAEAAQERRELSRLLQRIEQRLEAMQHQQSDTDARVQRLEALESSPRGVRWRLVREERNPAYQEQATRIRELEGELERARSRYNDDWPGLRQMRRAINEQRAGLVSIPEFISTVVEEVSEWPGGGGHPGGRGAWRQRVAELEIREQALADRSAALEEEYAVRRQSWERDLASMQADFNGRRVQLESRERQLAQRQRDLDRFNDKVRGLDRAQQQLVSGQAQLAQARQQLAQQQAAFDRAAKGRGNRDPRRGGEMARLQKDVDKLKGENDQLRKVVANHQRELDKLTRAKTQLDKALEERTREARKLKKERDALSQQLQGGRRTEKTGRVHPAAAAQRARELEQARRGYAKQITDLSTRINQLTAQVAQLQRRGDVAGANKLRVELSTLMAQLAKAKQQLEDLPER